MRENVKKEKLTIAALIAKKAELQQRKNKTACVETEIGIVTIGMPSREQVMDAQDMGNNGGDEYLVYECTKEPNLKDAKLQEAFDCGEPVNIVNAIFKPGEVTTIATLIMKLAGYVRQADFVKDTDETVKN